MSDLEVRSLLNKYWDGETSLEEEAQLRQYFIHDQVADEFAPYRALFTFFDASANLQMEADIAQPQLGSPHANQGKTIVRKMNWITSAAAAVILAIGLFYINLQLIPTPTIDAFAYEDTYEDPQVAYAEFKRMMGYVSGKMNKGVYKANKGINKIETLTDIIN